MASWRRASGRARSRLTSASAIASARSPTGQTSGRRERHQVIDVRAPGPDAAQLLGAPRGRPRRRRARCRRARGSRPSPRCASAWQYEAFWRVSPRRCRPRTPRSTTSSGVMSPSSPRTRRNRLRAATIETCCSSTMCTSVGNPGRRAHIGGRPFRAKRAARSGSRRAERAHAFRERHPGQHPRRRGRGTLACAQASGSRLQPFAEVIGAEIHPLAQVELVRALSLHARVEVEDVAVILDRELRAASASSALPWPFERSDSAVTRSSTYRCLPQKRLFAMR